MMPLLSECNGSSDSAASRIKTEDNRTSGGRGGKDDRMPFGTRIGLPMVSLVVAILFASSASGAEFTATYFFGDSLTDTGNLLSLDPNSDGDGIHWQGRKSNGLLWSDYVAEARGTNATASELGGTNYAAGGAYTHAPNFNPFGVPSLNNLSDPNHFSLAGQIGKYRSFSSNVADPGALYTIWMGHNDWAIGGAANTAPAAAVGVAVITQAIQDLYADGARNFLVPDILVFDPNAPNYIYGAAFNVSLDAELVTLEGSLAGIEVYRANAAPGMLAVSGDLAGNGYTGGLAAPTTCTRINNLFGPDTPGDPTCEAEVLASVDGLGVPIGETYFLHDGIHFTTRVNRELIAPVLSAELPPPVTIPTLSESALLILAASLMLICSLPIGGSRQRL